MVKPKQTSEDKLRVLHKLVLDSDSFFGSKEIEKLAEKAGYRSMQAKGQPFCLFKIKLDHNFSSLVTNEIETSAKTRSKCCSTKILFKPTRSPLLQSFGNPSAAPLPASSAVFAF